MSSGEEDYPIEDANDLERIQEGDEDVENNQEAIEDNAEESEKKDDEENKTVVKPKRVVRNPQPKLNDQTLKGPKGLGALPAYFERVKFKGKGHEDQDLNVLMKTYEYWCHRLFPKFPFEDCIEKLEKLGAKKTVQTHLKRIRMDLDFEEDYNKPVDSDNEEVAVVEENNTQFDELVASNTVAEPEINEEQLERMRLNREKAERLRQDKLKKIRERASSNLEESCVLPSQVDRSKENDDSEVNQEQQGIEDMLDNINKEVEEEASSKLKERSPQRKKNVLTSDSEDEHMEIDESVEKSDQKSLVEEENSEEEEEIINKENKIKTFKKKNVLKSDSEEEVGKNIVDTSNEESLIKNNTENEDKLEKIGHGSKLKNSILSSDSEDDDAEEKNVSDVIKEKVNIDHNKSDTQEIVSQSNKMVSQDVIEDEFDTDFNLQLE